MQSSLMRYAQTTTLKRPVRHTRKRLKRIKWYCLVLIIIAALISYRSQLRKKQVYENDQMLEKLLESRDEEGDNTANTVTKNVDIVVDTATTTRMSHDSKSRYTSSLRSESDKVLAQSCLRRKGEAGVYVKHFRKAGGTSLYQTLYRNTCETEDFHNVIPSFASEQPYFNYTHSFGNNMPTLVYLTSMRDPIDRIQSLYWFEGRWPRVCAAACEAEREKTNSTAIDFGPWIEAIYHQKDTPGRDYMLTFHSNCGQYQSVENYYIRQLLGVDRNQDINPKGENGCKTDKYGLFRNVTLTEEHLEMAKDVLAAFDLVIILEDLKTDDTLNKMIHELTGGGRRYPEAIPVQTERKGQERLQQYVKPTDKELSRLKELNALDMKLYEFAKTLSRKTVETWKQREEQGKSASIYFSDDELDEKCRKPDVTLGKEYEEILLGGCGCINRPLMYNGLCLYHSNMGLRTNWSYRAVRHDENKRAVRKKIHEIDKMIEDITGRKNTYGGRGRTREEREPNRTPKKE